MVRNETARAVRNLPAGTALARNKSLATRRRPRMEPWMAIPAGFEPATRGVEIRYSIQLSYGTVASISTIAVTKKPALASNPDKDMRPGCGNSNRCLKSPSTIPPFPVEWFSSPATINKPFRSETRCFPTS